jgi:hypothetical protein
MGKKVFFKYKKCLTPATQETEIWRIEVPVLSRQNISKFPISTKKLRVVAHTYGPS